MVNPSEVKNFFDTLVPYMSDLNLRQLFQFQPKAIKALIDIKDNFRKPDPAGADVLDGLLESSLEKLSLKGRALVRELFLGANSQIDQSQLKPVPRLAEVQKTDVVNSLECFLKSIIDDVAELNVNQFLHFKKQIVHLAMAVFDNPKDFKHREVQLIDPAPKSLIFDHVSPEQGRILREIVAEIDWPNPEESDDQAQICASDIGGAEEGNKSHTPTPKPLNATQATETLTASDPISTAGVTQDRGGSLLATTNSSSPVETKAGKMIPIEWKNHWRRSALDHADESKTKLSTGMNKASTNQNRMDRRLSIAIHNISSEANTERTAVQSCAIIDDNSLDQTNDPNGKLSPPLATSPKPASKRHMEQALIEEQQAQQPHEKAGRMSISPSLPTDESFRHIPEAWEFGLFYPDFEIEPED